MPICSLGVDSPQMKAAMAGTDVASGNPGSFDRAQWPAAVSAKDAVIRGREARFCSIQVASIGIGRPIRAWECKKLNYRNLPELHYNQRVRGRAGYPKSAAALARLWRQRARHQAPLPKQNCLAALLLPERLPWKPPSFYLGSFLPVFYPVLGAL